MLNVNANANGRDKSKVRIRIIGGALPLLSQQIEWKIWSTLIYAYYCCKYNLLSTIASNTIFYLHLHNGYFLTKLMRKFAIDIANAFPHTKWFDLVVNIYSPTKKIISKFNQVEDTENKNLRPPKSRHKIWKHQRVSAIRYVVRSRYIMKRIKYVL